MSPLVMQDGHTPLASTTVCSIWNPAVCAALSSAPRSGTYCASATVLHKWANHKKGV